MYNVCWFVLLLPPTLVCPPSYASPWGIHAKEPLTVCPVLAGTLPPAAGSYCHRVFETHMLPYFAQFPILEIDRSSASFWSSLLYRSAFARYGDQWDWESRRSFAAYWTGVRNGWIVPKSRSAAIRAPSGPMRSKDILEVSPKPVKVLNPFCEEHAPKEADHANNGRPLLEAGTFVRTTTSSGIMPLRIVNQFVR